MLDTKNYVEQINIIARQKLNLAYEHGSDEAFQQIISCLRLLTQKPVPDLAASTGLHPGKVVTLKKYLNDYLNWWAREKDKEWETKPAMITPPTPVQQTVTVGVDNLDDTMLPPPVKRGRGRPAVTT